jgi:hypothetical protein
VEQLRVARTCYDHLAGRLGVELTQALLDTKILQLEEQQQCYNVTEDGVNLLIQFGIDLEKLRRQRRSFARPCLDWSERRYHLAGALGAAFNERLLQLGWTEKTPSGRAVRLTKSGNEGLQRMFGMYFRFCE